MPQILHVFTMLALISSHLSGVDRKEHFHMQLMFVADTSRLSQVLYSVEAAAEPVVARVLVTYTSNGNQTLLAVAAPELLPSRQALPFQPAFQSVFPIGRSNLLLQAATMQICNHH